MRAKECGKMWQNFCPKVAKSLDSDLATLSLSGLKICKSFESQRTVTEQKRRRKREKPRSKVKSRFPEVNLVLHDGCRGGGEQGRRRHGLFDLNPRPGVEVVLYLQVGGIAAHALGEEPEPQEAPGQHRFFI